MQERSRLRLLAYTAAFPALVAGILVRWNLHDVLGQRALYSTFFPAVMIAAYFGGLWPGVLVTLVAAMAANAIVDPQLTLRFKGTGDTVAMLLFVVTGAIISGLSESLHRAHRRIVADERRRAAEARRETEDRFRQIVENIQEIFWISDARFERFLFISPVHEQIYGRKIDYQSDSADAGLEGVHPDDRAAVRANIEERRRGVFNSLEFRVVRPDGTVRWLRSRAFPIHDAAGALTGLAGLAADITDLKRSEEEIRKARDRLELAVLGSKLAIWEFDMPDGRIENSRPTFINVWESLGHDPGSAPADFIGAAALAVHPDDLPRVTREVRAFLEGDQREFEAEFRVRHRTGSDQWRLARGVALRTPAGTPVRFIGSFVDITELKRVETELRISEQRFRTFVDHATDGFFLFDEHNVVLDVNHQACERLGYTRDELIGMTPTDFDPDVTPADLAQSEQDLSRGMAIAFESRHRRKDGTLFPVEIRGRAFWEGGRRYTVALARDVTERTRAEAALRESEERFRGTFENAAVGIAHCAVDGRYLRVNEKYCAILGYSRDELLGMKFQDVTYREDLDPSRDSFFSLGRREVASYTQEKRVVRKDGSLVWINICVSLQTDSAGQPIHTIGVVQDVSERRRLEEELRRAKEAAEAANRAKDEFLANVSHEIRTPMNAILGMTELVLDTPLADDQRQSLRTVKSAADNLLGIINDLLDFSKIAAGKLQLDPGPFSLRAVVGETVRAIAVRAHRKGLELVCNIQSDVPDALIGDAGRLRQVLLNLVGNGIKFTEKGEVILDVEPAPDAEPAPEGELPIQFSVRDTGIGVPPEKRSTIFRAFEQEDNSTTRKYGGTGLGLTISAQLVALMGGRITVESEVGRGSTFSFTARFARQATPSGTPADAAPPPGLLRDLRVLVVDDNAANRHIVERWLAGWGMAPTSVGDGMAAMDALWHAVAVGKPHALLVLDARMPDTDGMTLAAKIRERAELSGSRIILLTSGDRPGDLARHRDLRVEGHLLKPVQQDELLGTIYSVMGRAAGTSDPAAVATRTGPPESAAATSRAVAPLRILVAEDSEFNAQLMEKLLAKPGHSVRLVSNGREALALASAADFDLLLLDLHMPELDGFQVIRAIRERERGTGSHLPVIALTARSRDEDRQRCLAAGMDDFLSKPIQAGDLWRTIHRVLPATQPGIAPLDARVLSAACGGDDAILQSLCQALRANLPAELAAVTQAFQNRDAQRLREAAHKVCGMVSAFSSVAGDTASDLEDLAARGELENARPLVEQLQLIGDRLVGLVANGLTFESLQRSHRPTPPA